MTVPLRPFNFIAVFWGKRYREDFTRFCAASMLAPGNIPALDPSIRDDSRFLVVTTVEDWRALQDDPGFQALSKSIATEHIVFRPPTKKEPKMLAMSRGHKLASEAAFRNKAYGVFLTPDLVLSDGSVVALQALGRQGKKVVLCLAVRFEEHGCVGELTDGGYLKPGAPLAIAPRDLVGIALRHLHTETLQYEWDTPYLVQSPISPFWRVPGDDGLVFHSFSWAPLLVDYSALDDHDTSTFEKWTLDGDYVYRNFAHSDDNAVHVVTDSDEIMLVSFTREEDLHFDLKPHWSTNTPVIGSYIKQSLLRGLYDSETMDPLKRRILPMGVRLRTGEPTKNWAAVERHARAIVERATLRPPGRRERFARWYSRQVFAWPRWQIGSRIWYAITYGPSRLRPETRARLRQYLGIAKAQPRDSA